MSARPLLVGVTLLLVGCASPKEGAPPVERTAIVYDSTRATSAEAPEPPAPPGEACKHSWVAERPHLYWDTSFDPPMSALCSPVTCTKCGLTRHECAPRRRKR